MYDGSLSYGPLPWRVGPSPRNIYDANGEPVTTMASERLAELVVTAVNALAQGDGAKALIEGWLAKDFNALYSAAHRASEAPSAEALQDLGRQVARLAPAFQLTKNLRVWARSLGHGDASLPTR